MSLPAALVNKTTRALIRKANYPCADINDTVPGLDADKEWLIIREDTLPIYDERVYDLVTSETATTIPDAEYSHLNVYQVNYSTQRRENTVISDNARERELQANTGIIPIQKQLKYMALGLGVIFRNYNIAGLTPNEQVIANKWVSIATRLFTNDTNLQTKLAEIAANQDPDLDTGWDETEE